MRIVYIFIVTIFCILPKVIWPGSKVDISNIKSNKYPIYKNFKLELIEETFINGSDCPDEYLLGVYDMAIDSKGNFFFVTWGKVLKFNKRGKFQKIFCNIKGEGPGQLQQEPFRLYVDKKDNLYITGGYKIAKFSPNGNFVKNIKVFTSGDFIISPKNYIFCMKYIYKGNRTNRLIALRQFNFGGKMVSELIVAPDQITVRMRGGGGYRYYWHYYTPKIYFCATENGGICFGYNGDYTLYVTDPDGKITKTIRVNLLKEKVKSNEIKNVKKTSFANTNNKAYLRNMPIPKYKPFFNKLLSDEKGRIYVVRIQPVLTRKEYEIIDIFSKDGRFLYQVNIPYVPGIIRDGMIFTEDKSDKENIKVKKLIIKNYENMKY